MPKSMSIYMQEKGDFKKTLSFLKSMQEKRWVSQLDHFGEMGVKYLSEATPKDTGLTANSWHYEIVNYEDNITLRWYNTNVVKDYFNVALMLQYGHGTRNGTWVEGIDYINPAMKKVMEECSGKIWEEVTKS